MEKYAVILAGGEGRRAGGSVPKQFRMLSGRPMVWWSARAFLDAFPEIRIVMVVHPDFIEEWRKMQVNLREADRFPHTVCRGGSSRPESVANGLRCIESDYGAASDAIVFIHDGARPLVTPEMVRRGACALEKNRDGVIPAVRAVNSLRELTTDPALPLEMAESISVERARYVEVQTPQIFHLSLLLPLYREASRLAGFTDDASVAESVGKKVGLYEGDTSNIKVTHPLDFCIAEAILRERERKG